jgi:sterol desaturase/sphingolipid hydroxylase (fatty acid hydroxylase superfamily)
MTAIPLLDFLGAPLLGLVFILLWRVQQSQPLRKPKYSLLKRAVRNFVFALPAFVTLRLLLIPIPLSVAVWAQQNDSGILHWINASNIITALVGFLWLDYSYYWWHVATHRVPLLWRFHNVHHTDLDMDVSTAARFHFGELVLSVVFRVMQVLIMGVSPLVLLIFEIAFEWAGQFHHSNWRLSAKLEAALSRVLVTPRMHGIHHSVVPQHTDSNWGTIFSWWDKLHQTHRADVSQDELTIGVPQWRDENELKIFDLWKMPFRKQRSHRADENASI